jgi:hypothetical protein
MVNDEKEGEKNMFSLKTVSQWREERVAVREEGMSDHK